MISGYDNGLFTLLLVQLGLIAGVVIVLAVARQRRGRSPVSAGRGACALREDVSCACELGSYKLLAKLGSGGMGEVFVARHAMLERLAAVKLLRPGKLDEGSLARFEREVQSASQLSHPNTIRIFDYGRTTSGVLFFAMEHLEGADLATVIDRTGPMDPGRVLHVLAGVADSLAEAHHRGLVHRDIKPANIFLLSTFLADHVKVLDFGLVKNLESEGALELTAAEVVAGTPYYLSPESISDPGRVRAPADIYSLGCVAYFLLTGRHVFQGASAVEVCTQHLHSVPGPMSPELGVPPALEALLMACLAKDPLARPDTEVLVGRIRELGAREWAAWERADGEAWWEEHTADLQEPEAPRGEEPERTGGNQVPPPTSCHVQTGMTARPRLMHSWT